MNRSAIEARQLRYNKFFGELSGIWPTQTKESKYTARILILIIICTTNAAQIAQVVVFFNFDVLTDQLAFLALGFGILIKKYNYILNEEKLIKLLDGVVSDWLIERPEAEMEILEKYHKRAVYYSNFYAGTLLVCTIAFLTIPATPRILDFVMPLNVSRPRLFIYPSYYFVDEEQYYYPIIVHMALSALILYCVFVACDLNLVLFVQHACGLFTISGYRFKHATDDTELGMVKTDHGIMEKSFLNVCRSIDAHKRAIEFVELVQACHVAYFIIAIAIIVMVFTVTFVKITIRYDYFFKEQLASMETNTTYVVYCAFTFGQLIHLFFLTIMGQFVIDSNDEIYERICEAHWYNGSTKTQSLYVLVLRKCLNQDKLTGGGLISLNLDSFVMILKASLSYYTVLKSS